MDDLISRQAAIDAIIKRDANCGIDSAEVLRLLPSAQPEIISCKDCAYYDKDYSDELSDWCHVWSETTSEDGYCHNAERGEVQE